MGALGVLWMTLLIGLCLQAARGADALDNPCGPKANMYHPYPGDPFRYIQCTAQGRMYVRHCNNGQSWDEYRNTCNRVNHHVHKVPQQARTYNPHEPRERAKEEYVETNYAASQGKQFQRYAFSPLSYVYLMSGQPNFALDTQGDNSANSRYTSDVSSSYRRGSNSPYWYQYSFTPGRTSNRRVISTSYGTTGGTSHDKSHSNAYSIPKSSSSSSGSKAGYATSGSSMKVVRPQVSYKRVQGKSLSARLMAESTSGTAASSHGTVGSNRYVVSSGSPSRTGYYSTSYTSSKSNAHKASGSNVAHGSSYSLPHGTSYSTGYVAAPQKTPSASYSSSHGAGYTAYGIPQTNIYGLSHGSAQGTGSWYNIGRGTTYGTGVGIGQSKSFTSTNGKAHGSSYGSVYGTGYAVPYKSGQDRYGSAQGTGYVSPAHTDHTHPSKGNSHSSTSYGSVKSTGYHTAYDRQPHGTSSTFNTAPHGFPYVYQQANQYTAHQPTPAKSTDLGHQIQGKSTMHHTQTQTVNHDQTLINQCSGGNVRYFADPNSPKHYYECQSYQRLARYSCDGNSLWVQPLRMCVDPQDQLSTGIPTVNPCAGTDTMYKPYPTDPSKYIECRRWYSILVWSCRPHQVWAQSQQRCVNMKIHRPIVHPKPAVRPKPIEPKQYPPHQPKSTNPCDYTTTFYEKYHPDPSKYIQCDEFKEMFIRDCYSGGTWDDQIKACIKLKKKPEPETMPAFEYNFDRAKPLNIDDYEATYDTGASYQYTSAQSGAKTLNVETRKCHEHELWVPSLLKCVSLENAVLNSENCHPGDYYFPEHYICAAVTSTIEPKSLTHDTHTYTDYHSYIRNDKQNYDDYLTDNHTTKTVAANPHCTTFNPIPSDDSPCGTGAVMYHPFPHDDRCFIQCSQNHDAFVMPCATGTGWKQEALNCVQKYYPTPENDGSTMRASGKSLFGSGAGDGSLDNSQPSADHQLSNVCYDESSTTYKEYPEAAHMFIMCTEHSGYSMSCPISTHWRQDIQACVYPEAAPN